MQRAIIRNNADELGIKTIVAGIEENDKTSEDEHDSDDEEGDEPDEDEAYNEQQGSKKGKKKKGKAAGKGKGTRRPAFWVVVTSKLRELLKKYGPEYKGGEKWKEYLFRFHLIPSLCLHADLYTDHVLTTDTSTGVSNGNATNTPMIKSTTSSPSYSPR